MLKIKTILHPTDFSKHSECAFRLACSLARDHGARVVALHVVTPILVVDGEGLIPPLADDDEERAREQLGQLQSPDPQVQLERLLAHGDAATEILRMAAQTECDLVVMGTHGWTGFSRLVMGSVAEQIVRKAPCPVLTVKTPQGREPSEGRAPMSVGQGATATG
jgi:nucleotide-binding universal stress UspA family protein